MRGDGVMWCSRGGGRCGRLMSVVWDETGDEVAAFFFRAEVGIRDSCLSRGLGDAYVRSAL